MDLALCFTIDDILSSSCDKCEDVLSAHFLLCGLPVLLATNDCHACLFEVAVTLFTIHVFLISPSMNKGLLTMFLQLLRNGGLSIPITLAPDHIHVAEPPKHYTLLSHTYLPPLLNSSFHNMHVGLVRILGTFYPRACIAHVGDITSIFRVASDLTPVTLAIELKQWTLPYTKTQVAMLLKFLHLVNARETWRSMTISLSEEVRHSSNATTSDRLNTEMVSWTRNCWLCLGFATVRRQECDCAITRGWEKVKFYFRCVSSTPPWFLTCSV